MQLLYCDSSGTVVGTHDSGQQVEAGAYGSGIRVIPYDQPLSTLPRIGAAPVWPERDTRPYGQPVETPAVLRGYSAQARWEAVVIAGITYNTIAIKTDRVSQAQIASLAQYAGTVPGTTTIDFIQDGVHNQITATDAIAISNQISALIQQCRTIEAACIADLNSPTPTILTYADVDTRFAGVARTKSNGRANLL
jgi:hypothetical protein